MSVVRGRPPGLAGGIIGTSRAYCSSLRACPAPKSPTKARLSAVHMTCLQQGCPLLNADPASVCPSAHPSRIGFSNGLLGHHPTVCIRPIAGADRHRLRLQREGLPRLERRRLRPAGGIEADLAEYGGL